MPNGHHSETVLDLAEECARLRQLNAEMLVALKCVREDMQHHLRSDAIDHALIRRHALQKVVNAIRKTEEHLHVQSHTEWD